MINFNLEQINWESFNKLYLWKCQIKTKLMKPLFNNHSIKIIDSVKKYKMKATVTLMPFQSTPLNNFNISITVLVNRLPVLSIILKFQKTLNNNNKNNNNIMKKNNNKSLMKRNNSNKKINRLNKSNHKLNYKKNHKWSSNNKKSPNLKLTIKR